MCLLAALGHRQPATTRATTSEYEVLAGEIGRANAWFEMYAGALPAGGSGSAIGQAASRRSSTVFTSTVFLPFVSGSTPTPVVERRAIWVTRYDWTSLTSAPAPEAIDEIVANVASAGFNTILFQVRGGGDAYYTPSLEPWSDRLTTGPVSETLGVDPGWDPLVRMIAAAHTAGVEVHAYVNVYTAWLSPASAAYGQLWPPATQPPQMFDRFTYGPNYAAHPGVYGLGYTWRQHDQNLAPMSLDWGRYLWATPGSDEVQAHVLAVVRDIVDRYEVDGIHLDLVRYAGPGYSYDPFSNAAAGSVRTSARDRWQRDRVTSIVQQVHTATTAALPDALVSAAVWPYYVDIWGWGVTEGYYDYFQDSKGWLSSGAADAIAPMLYGGLADDFSTWQTLLLDFAGLGQVLPGVGGAYADFDDISRRIAAVRAYGFPGHAVFSYSGLDVRGHWDDLANGPYRMPAVLP